MSLDAFSDYRYLLLYLIPFILTGYFLLRASNARSITNRRWWTSIPLSDLNLVEVALHMIAFFIVTSIFWNWGRNVRINDYPEEIGAFVTEKQIKDGDYTATEDCNCSTNSDGERSCSTCTYTVYYRDFIVINNSGDWWNGWVHVDRLTSRSEMSRNEFSPTPYYAASYISKPLSIPNGYPNYIAPLNESLYKSTYAGLSSVLPDICPAVPNTRVNAHSVVKAQALGFPQGSPIPNEIYQWNFYEISPEFKQNSFDPNTENPYDIPLYLDTMFGYLGRKVQGDIHLYVVNSPESSYADMCLAKWKNGAKNAIYVFIFGQSDGSSFSVSDVAVRLGVDGLSKKNTGLSESDVDKYRSNDLMKYNIRADILNYSKGGGEFNRENILSPIFNRVNSEFVRQEMADFKALKQFIKPTGLWMSAMALAILIVDFIALSILADNGM